MVVLNAETHTFADEVPRADVQLQALKDDAYQNAVVPMTPSSARGCCQTSCRG